MKFTVLLLSSAALATTLGVVCGYLPIGLTPVSAAACLALGFLFALLGLFFSPGPWFRRFETVQASGLVMIAVFSTFALFACSQLIFVDNDVVKVLSPNNLGDICLHLTHINYLASNPHFWPENPIFAFDQLHYPFATNLFNAELKLVGVETRLGIILFALVFALATLRTLFAFGGPFAVATFLFNGGLAGFAFFRTLQLADYQAELAWKSIPLSLFVTQRGLLFAIPAGLVLITHWRAVLNNETRPCTLPGWAECLLYCTMPFFHLHTFLFLSFLLLWWFLFGPAYLRLRFLRLVLFSLVPASFFAFSVTGLQTHGAVAWEPNWMCEPSESPWWFWTFNFGLLLPLAAALAIYLAWPQPDLFGQRKRLRLILYPAIVVFCACGLFRFAPWNWDNTKLFLWAYLFIMIAIWEGLLADFHLLLRIPIVFGLFASGAISFMGGLVPPPGQYGYEIGRLSEWQQVATALAHFSPATVFATYPTYNHPVLVSGHRVVLGFPGHLWSHGLPYRPYEIELDRVMNGGSDWKQLANRLKIDYLFWGPFEEKNFPDSTHPWENTCPLVAQGNWGKLYDLRTLH
jgi:hypothetical protein